MFVSVGFPLMNTSDSLIVRSSSATLKYIDTKPIYLKIALFKNEVFLNEHKTLSPAGK